MGRVLCDDRCRSSRLFTSNTRTLGFSWTHYLNGTKHHFLLDGSSCAASWVQNSSSDLVVLLLSDFTRCLFVKHTKRSAHIMLLNLVSSYCVHFHCQSIELQIVVLSTPHLLQSNNCSWATAMKMTVSTTTVERSKPNMTREHVGPLKKHMKMQSKELKRVVAHACDWEKKTWK